MSKVADMVLRLSEGDDDFENDEFLKDVYEPDPVQYRPVDVPGAQVLDLFIGENWIGRVRRSVVRGEESYWTVNWLPERTGIQTGIIKSTFRFKSIEEAAEFLTSYWQMPESVESRETKVLGFVEVLAEGDDDFEDDEVKDYNYDQLQIIVQALTKAGFKIERSEREGDEMILEFSWPAPDAVTYLSGAKRAKELIAPYISLSQHNFSGKRVGSTASIFIHKRIEDDPYTWKVTPQPTAHDWKEFQSWHDILFNDQKVGEAYLPGIGGTQVERFREELAALHKLVPFNAADWQGEGNSFGSGPAVEWWRKNRVQLTFAPQNRPYLDPGLLDKNYGLPH